VAEKNVRGARVRRLFMIHPDVWAIVAAAILGLSWSAGATYEASVEAGSPGITDALPVVLAGLLIAVPAYFLIALLFHWLDVREVHIANRESARGVSWGTRHVDPERGLGVVPAPFPPARAVLTGALVLLVLWIPYLVIRFPGNLDQDTLWQLLEHAGYATASDHHPWFDTMVIGLFWDLGDLLGSHLWSLLLCAISQMVLTALSMGVMLWYIRDVIGAPRGFVRGCTLFLGLLPFVPLTLLTMGKDSLFGWTYVLFFVAVVECARTRGAALRSRRFLVSVIVVTLLTMLTKKTSLLVDVGTLLVVALWCKGSRARVLAWAAVPVILYLVWSNLLLGAMGVAKGDLRDVMSIPSQQVATVVAEHGDELSDADLTTIEKCWGDPSAFATALVPTRADATKNCWKDDASMSDKAAGISLWLSLGLRYPGSYANALLGLTCQVWAPVVQWPVVDDTSAETGLYVIDNVPGDVSGYQEYFDSSWWLPRLTADEVSSLMGGATHPAFAETLSAGFDTVYNAFLSVFPQAFSKAPYALWAPLIVMAWCLRRRRWGLAAALMASVLTLASIIVSPLALPRYLVPAVFTAPLVLGLVFTTGADTDERALVHVDEELA
jgi:hypothetical protein